MRTGASQGTGTTGSAATHDWWYVAAGSMLSVLAGLIHLAVAPEHFHEATVVGAFFIVAGAGQLALAVALLRGLGTPALLLAVVANVGLVCLYVLSRTVALPFVPPHSEFHHLPVAGAAGNGVPIFPGDRIETVGRLDLTCLVAELGLLVMLVAMLPGTKTRRVTTNALMGLGLAALAARVAGVIG